MANKWLLGYKRFTINLTWIKKYSQVYSIKTWRNSKIKITTKNDNSSWKILKTSWLFKATNYGFLYFSANTTSHWAIRKIALLSWKKIDLIINSTYKLFFLLKNEYYANLSSGFSGIPRSPVNKRREIDSIWTCTERN